MSSFDLLPNEMTVEILGYLDRLELFKLKQVSKEFKELVRCLKPEKLFQNKMDMWCLALLSDNILGAGNLKYLKKYFQLNEDFLLAVCYLDMDAVTRIDEKDQKKYLIEFNWIAQSQRFGFTIDLCKLLNDLETYADQVIEKVIFNLMGIFRHGGKNCPNYPTIEPILHELGKLSSNTNGYPNINRIINQRLKFLGLLS